MYIMLSVDPDQDISTEQVVELPQQRALCYSMLYGVIV